MIARGADVNARMSRNGMKDGQRNRLNRLGATPFLLAAKNTDVEVMRLLVAAGADPTIPTADGTTPLMVAAGVAIWNPGEDGGSLAGQEPEVLEAVKMCVELGNDVNAANDLGETALHGAAFRGVNEVVEYLVDQGAKLDARDTRGLDAAGHRQRPHLHRLLQATGSHGEAAARADDGPRAPDRGTRRRSRRCVSTACRRARINSATPRARPPDGGGVGLPRTSGAAAVDLGDR